MKIDFTQTLKALNGKSITVRDEDRKEQPLTLSVVSTNALLNALVGPDGRPEQQDGEAKLKQWELAKKIHKKSVELKAEEITIIKTRLGKLYDTSIVGPAFELLEGK